MKNKKLLKVYNWVTQEEHNEYEAMYELMASGVDIKKSELKKALSYFILKSYLLENNLI